MKDLIAISLFCSLSLTMAAQDNTSADSVYTTVDVPPEFPGGRKALGKYIDGRNHRYPEEARKNKIEGRVVVEFIINEDGTPSHFKVVEGIGYGCDEAAVEALRRCQSGTREWSMADLLRSGQRWLICIDCDKEAS